MSLRTARTVAEIVQGYEPPRVSAREPHWYGTIYESGCLLCGYRSSRVQRVRMPGSRPDDPSLHFAVDEHDWACGSHFL